MRGRWRPWLHRSALWRPWLHRSALSGGSTVLTLVLAELVLRVLGYAPPRWVQPVTVEAEGKRTALDLYPDPSDDFDVDLRRPADRARFADFVTDAHVERTPFGVAKRYTPILCRGAEPEERGAQRVVLLGDSFTEGLGVREEDTFAARLETASRQVINCGRRGANFPKLRRIFDRSTEAYAPDVVVYAMNLNDAIQSRRFYESQSWVNDWIVERSRMLAEEVPRPRWWDSRLAALLEERVVMQRVAAATERWYRDLLGPLNEEGWTQTLDEIAAMDSEARRLVVFVLPLLMELEAYPFREEHARIVEALQARGIEAYDLYPAFAGADEARLWVHPRDHHPNAEGHARIAAAMEERL